ncbi:hypothetical protein [Rhodoplanes roseus]|uniref:Amidohydrolase-related domain-containing protein n=1 Tax=Rhodoplanes roseus TaxID=29409 RepID=A0A327L295_9BRAD|nr:hypothetical protein [Rhodoplanes roseus]RAI44374.1 hypothetical protein CH341_09475 [Rhodoplanes roseus]
MEEAGAKVQVVSQSGPNADLLPPDEAPAMARAYNDRPKQMVDAHPDRFAGFAHLPMTAPEAAADDLQCASDTIRTGGRHARTHAAGHLEHHQRDCPEQRVIVGLAPRRRLRAGFSRIVMQGIGFTLLGNPTSPYPSAPEELNRFDRERRLRAIGITPDILEGQRELRDRE